MHPVRIAIKFSLQRISLLAVIGLLILSQACAGPSSFFRYATTPKVSIIIAEESAVDRESAVFRIRRDLTEGALAVVLSISGDAVLGKDVTIGGADRMGANMTTVTIPDGRNYAEITVAAASHSPAEAEQTVTLTLEPAQGYTIDKAAGSVTMRLHQNDLIVTTTNDAGEGSLRQAILNANALVGPDTIRFESVNGSFATPQIIALNSELPDLTGDLIIDGYIEGRLWKATGVTVSGGSQHRVFSVAPGAKVTIRSLTVADGRAEQGGGILNRGELVIKGVTLMGNTAASDGGGLANLGGLITVINSTFANNTAGNGGGGLADIDGTATVTNCTFFENTAKTGGGLFSTGTLLLRNTMLANSEGEADCSVTGALDPASTNNLIEINDGCGEPISKSDPRLEPLGYYNGPTKTFPISGGSPAINLGDNASAVDELGNPLIWDQRGNGDPRFVAGITDIGAFEHQRHPHLTVDTAEDTELRACTRAGKADCSLRGAITLANARRKADVITFDPNVFNISRTIALTRSLPDLATDMTIDAGDTAGVTVSSEGRFSVFNVAADAKVELINITEE
jgi:predicted outer membrane repeat protein